VPVWRLTGGEESPWMLRLFDRLRFTPVSAEELLAWREDIASGQRGLDTKPTTFSLAEASEVAELHEVEISEFRTRRDQAFEAERARWVADAAAANA
jgi:hypothetical protein